MPIPTHFHFTNTSHLDLLGLQLNLSSNPCPVSTCTIIRQRGTLTFDSPLSTIPLGNLYPEESIDIYFTFYEDMPPLTSTDLLHSLLIDEQSYDSLPIPTPLADYILLSTEQLSDI